MLGVPYFLLEMRGSHPGSAKRGIKRRVGGFLPSRSAKLKLFAGCVKKPKPVTENSKSTRIIKEHKSLNQESQKAISNQRLQKKDLCSKGRACKLKKSTFKTNIQTKVKFAQYYIRITVRQFATLYNTSLMENICGEGSFSDEHIHSFTSKMLS